MPNARAFYKSNSLYVRIFFVSDISRMSNEPNFKPIRAVPAALKRCAAGRTGCHPFMKVSLSRREGRYVGERPQAVLECHITLDHHAFALVRSRDYLTALSLPRSFIVDLDHDRTDHIRDYSTTLQLQASGPCDGPSEKSKLYQDISTTVVSISTAMSAYPLS